MARWTEQLRWAAHQWLAMAGPALIVLGGAVIALAMIESDVPATRAAHDRVWAGLGVIAVGSLLGVAAAFVGRHGGGRLPSGLEELVRDLPDAVFEIDGQGRIRFVSAAASDLLGRSPAELIGRELTSVLAELGGEGLAELPPAELAPGAWPADEYGILRHQMRLRHPDIGERWISATLRLTRHADGEVAAARGVLRDVSIQNAIEEALRASEERFRTILEVSRAWTRWPGHALQHGDLLLTGLLMGRVARPHGA